MKLCQASIPALAPPSTHSCEGGARSRRRWAAALALWLALGTGCGGGSAAPGDDHPAGTGGASGGSAGGQAGAAGSGKVSFAADVYERVIKVRCISCHSDAPSFGGLALFPGGAPFAYGNLVSVPAGAEAAYLCKDSGLMRVKPGDPEHSLIYLKLTNPPCGSKMPPAAFTQVTEEQVSLVKQWIMDGAAP